MWSWALLRSELNPYLGLCAANLWPDSSRTSSELSRELGWTPQKTERDFKDHFLEEAGLIVAAELCNGSAPAFGHYLLSKASKST